MKQGLTRFRGVDLATGEELFREDLGNLTINAGEFLGVVAAVKYIIEQGYTPGIIYTDSQTAITWFRNKQCASKKHCSALFKAEVFLRVFSAGVDSIQVRHWDNERWGETPADFSMK